MRFRNLFITILAAVCITGCGADKASTPPPTPVASAGVLPAVASSVPDSTATAVAPPVVPTVGVQTGQPPIAPATPTPLATAQPVVVVRTPTIVAARAATTMSPLPPSPQPPVSTQPPTAARANDLPGVAPQQVIGSAHDGLVLLNVRVGKNDGFTRVVFDLAKPDGSAAPVPQARLWRDGETVVVAFDGVRDDAYARSIGGSAQQINTGSVQSLYRIQVRDDSATAYGIAIHGGGKATMSTAASPTRVIVDIADK